MLICREFGYNGVVSFKTFDKKKDWGFIMLHIKKVGVFSLGKMLGLLYALLGLIIGALFSCFSLLGSAAMISQSGSEGAFGLIFGLGGIIFFPLIYGVMGFIGGLLVGVLYNVIAGLVGGIELYTE